MGSQSQCRICSNTDANKNYLCREKMFGLKDRFLYFQCAQCGCLQIATIPGDLSRYYPANYYSFNSEPVPQKGLKSWLAGKRDAAVATGTGFPGTTLGQAISARLDLLSLAALPARKDMAILDVGCGGGNLLSVLRRAGFPYLAGIDPYLDRDNEVLPALWVRKLPLKQITDQFDLIMLHHTFEHVEDGLEMLSNCRRILKPAGKILVRSPTIDSDAWDNYRTNWVQLDAPRHLFLHSGKSFDLLARCAGLTVKKCWCDSTAFQYWGSELYEKGFALYDRNGRVTAPGEHFTKSQMRRFTRKARAANARERGDQVVLVLSRAKDT
jgi:SAM-dependent methyltransferase